MARQNRVTPEGAIIADPARGLYTGNRGILHGAAGQILAPWRHKAWICCAIDFKGWRRKVMSPGTWTELFFLDEATALSAGHRPCALCRRADYVRFRQAWAAAGLDRDPRAKDMDDRLHRARIGPDRRAKRSHAALSDSLPDGTFLRLSDGPAMIWGQGLLPWTPAGYGAPLPRPAGQAVTVLTPAPIVAVLGAGYLPCLHPSAQAMSHLR